MPSSPTTTRIIGIDPGSRVTGYGVIEATGPACRHIAHGCIRSQGGELASRLLHIHGEMAALLQQWLPGEAAVESVFVKHHAASALILGQARGVVMLALAQGAIPLAEYAPAQVKSAIAGHGRAEKAQMQHMVRLLLNLPVAPAADAADALALALCHAHSRRIRLASAGQLTAGRRA